MTTRPIPPAADPHQDLASLAGQKLGNYRLERLVGRGRMGAVYLAKDEALLRPTAVKILSWRAGSAGGIDPVQWFLAEARLVARINHPRVVQIYGAARQGDLCYMAMEYVAGSSAAAAIEREGRMSPESATDVLVQAASALSAAHRCGVIHRDVKPANLLLGPGGVTKLGDFGMALGLSGPQRGTSHLRVGTPFFTAPEIWRGEAAGPASDLYSLGATYFQLLTGQPPFPGGDVGQVEQAHLRAAPPDLRQLAPEVPAACAALVRRALAKDPRERQGSAQDLMWEGQRILQELAGAGARAPEVGEADPAAAPLPAWARSLGFVRTPFAAVDAAAAPYEGEPFASVATQLAARADDDDTAVFALTGGPGSGRTVLCRRLAAMLGRSRLVLAADLAEDATGEALLRRVCRAVGGAHGADGEASLDLAVERLEEERRRSGRRPLVIVDGVAAPPALIQRLARAAGVTRSFRLLAAGSAGLGAVLGRGLPEAAPEIALPPLGREQVEAYVRSWLAATRDPSARLLLFSPDALMLLAMRSGGAPGRINQLAENMLVAAAGEGGRVLTSFHAWTAPEDQRWSGPAAPSPPRRPADWPPAAVTSAIDACRRATGMRPYPATEVPRGAALTRDP